MGGSPPSVQIMFSATDEEKEETVLNYLRKERGLQDTAARGSLSLPPLANL